MVILDQAWAINAIYTLFDRQKPHYAAILGKNGWFQLDDLDKVWSAFPANEQELFLLFMQKCHICFPYKTVRNKSGFIAPALMEPDIPEQTAENWQKNTNDYYIKYEHPFLHYGNMQQFIVKTHHLAEVTQIWKNGTVITDASGIALVEGFFKPQEQSAWIQVRVRGASPKILLDKVRNKLNEILGKPENMQVTCSLDGNTFLTLPDNKDDLPPKYWVFLGVDVRNTFEVEVLDRLRNIDKTTQETDKKLDAFTAFYQKFNKIRKDETSDEEHTIRLLEKEISHVTRLHDMQAYENRLRQDWFGGTIKIHNASLKSLAEALFFKEIQEAHHLESYAVIVLCLAKAVENELNLRIAEPLRSVDLSALTGNDCVKIREHQEQHKNGKQSFPFGSMNMCFNEIRKALAKKDHLLESVFSAIFNNPNVIFKRDYYQYLDYASSYNGIHDFNIPEQRNVAAHAGKPINREECELYMEMVKAFLVMWNESLK
jgi:hypothetical protein